jgi:GT2 family glycosyltransferase
MQSFLNNKYFNTAKIEEAVVVPVETEPLNPVETIPGFTSIIIPAYFLNYPLFHYTGHCIGSVREHTNKDKTPYEIILVVNGKTGIGFSNPEESKADKVIEIEKNVGYGSAMNRGIRAAKGEYVVLLSNDVLVFDYWLSNFHMALQYKDLVMATPMYGMPYARALESKELMEKWIDHGVEETFSDFRDFSCVAAKKKLFEEVGLFDENLYLYKEDLDLFNRMDKAGKTYASTKLINTFHVIAGTSIYMSEEDQKKAEGEKYYSAKWGKT